MKFIFKYKVAFSLILGMLLCILGFADSFFPMAAIPINVFVFFISSILILKTVKLWELKNIRDDELKAQIQKEKEKVLKGYNSYINQLSNIIAGINHEVAPWLGGIQNKISRLREKASKTQSTIPARMNRTNNQRKYMSDEFTVVTPEYTLKRLADIEIAADTAIKILKTRSRDVKKLQMYSTGKSILYETVETWVGIAMVDRSVKCDISLENLKLNYDSLNFEANHSPLLLSQVILNLVKNSVEHNSNMLENLLISITGDSTRNCIIYEDNGKGIPEDKLSTIFEPGITSKHHEKEIHGLGLSLCVDYCECMGAVITAEKSNTGAKFVIYFDYDYEKNPLKLKVESGFYKGDVIAI